MRYVGRQDKAVEFGFEEGRSATEIPTDSRPMAAAGQEWRADLGLIACSMGLKRAFANVSPKSLSLVMKEMDKVPMVPGAILREQNGGIFDICFQETRVRYPLISQPSKVGKKAHPCSA